MAEPPTKRRRLSSDEDHDSSQDTLYSRGKKPASSSSVFPPISPPRTKKAKTRTCIASPFRLTTIRDLPDECNVGAVSLGDLIGDPLVAELWDFNYLHDIDFLLGHLDEDTRALTRVHVVHGFWKREDPNRVLLQEQARQYKNVTLHTAYMPEMFGTHHSKMLILFRHDDMAQVIIHTANMIAKDWTNMTNGVWASPPLPKQSNSQLETTPAVGSGERFKADLTNYLRAYNKMRNVCGSLVQELASYDFSSVRGALVASVPGKHDLEESVIASYWGWAGLRNVLKNVPVQAGHSDIAIQISSIATLGANDTWLQRTLFDSLTMSYFRPEEDAFSFKPRPDLKVIFPTPDEIRRSLDGYESGGSIHTKTQSAAQAKQLQYLRPLFHHWANDSARGVLGSTSASRGGDPAASRDAGRKRAAPHIKTYIRYGEKSIDWALLTSANLSRQAWGDALNSAGEVRIASWEIGVLVWPELLAGDAEARMVGTFKTDEPERDDEAGDGTSPVVGLRIPYDLPLQKYGNTEVPWVATIGYAEPDRMGRIWPGY
ncbi:tyrosyl-DNA phosphodiesterase [Nemania sp. FL0916]|nr:tyrosyl-DNA phosphodiesterase [Nemania sp. FL0916]